MSKTLQIVNGIARLRDFPIVSEIYDQIYTASGTVTAGTNITLPASGTYSGAELKVFFNGQILTLTSDYSYVGSGSRTQIQLTFDIFNGEQLRFKKGD